MQRLLRRGLAAVALGAAASAGAQGVASPAGTPAPTPPDRDYLVFVASEGNDQIALLRFGPKGASVERRFRMGFNPTELVGPHGIGVAPDGRHYYVSTAHGTPNGSLWKYTTAGDSLLGRIELGPFPATLQVSPDGAYVFVVNFNFHGDMVPSSVSVVYGDQMVEVARVKTCTMPHGSRLSPDGTRHYSACMMDDMLVEIDATKMGVARHFMLTKGKEHGMAGAPGMHNMVAMAGQAAGGAGHDEHAGHDAAAGAAAAKPAMPAVTCSPTWAQPSADGKKVYVACNKANEILEVDVATWTLGRRIAAGDGPYNLAATRDGKLLVATNKRGASASVFDLATGKELARIATTRRVTSGVAISPDDRYAFVTDEGIGAQPGTVDVLDLRSLTKVATVDVGQQAGGIDVWKTETPR